MGPTDLWGAAIIVQLSCKAAQVMHSGHTDVTEELEAGLWRPCLKPAPECGCFDHLLQETVVYSWGANWGRITNSGGVVDVPHGC